MRTRFTRHLAAALLTSVSLCWINSAFAQLSPNMQDMLRRIHTTKEFGGNAAGQTPGDMPGLPSTRDPRQRSPGAGKTRPPPTEDVAFQGLLYAKLPPDGTGDDNVHFQDTQRMVNKLIDLNKQFSFMEYPNRRHEISGIHLDTLRYGFLEQYLSAGGR